MAEDDSWEQVDDSHYADDILVSYVDVDADVWPLFQLLAARL